MSQPAELRERRMALVLRHMYLGELKRTAASGRSFRCRMWQSAPDL